MSDVPSRSSRHDRTALERDRDRAARPGAALEHVHVRNDDAPDEFVVAPREDADAPAGAWIVARGEAFVSLDSIR